MEHTRAGIGIAFAALHCALLLGCHRAPSRREMEAETARMRDLVSSQLKWYQRQLALYKDVGVAEVTMSPGRAALWIDGAEYVGRQKDIMLPAGAHEFKAVWPDGTSATRRIYIEPAAPEATLKFESEQTRHGMKVRWKTEDAKVRKTPVRLQRPRG